jgi:hypothetical protein
MTRVPGRPKSEDPKRSLPIRVRSSILAGFSDTGAARAAVEALVEEHFGPKPYVPAPPGFELRGFAEYTPMGSRTYAPEPAANTVERVAPAIHVDVPVYAPKRFNPRPKTGKPPSNPPS